MDRWRLCQSFCLNVIRGCRKQSTFCYSFLSKVVIKMSASCPACSLPVNPVMWAGGCLCGLSRASSSLPCVSFLLSFFSLAVLSSLSLICVYRMRGVTHTHTCAHCAWCGFRKAVYKLRKNVLGSSCPQVPDGLQNFMFSVLVFPQEQRSHFSRVLVSSVSPLRDEAAALFILGL